MSAVLQSRTDRDTRGSLYLVAGQHPNLDARRLQRLNSQLHIVLQSVFHSGHSQEFKVTLKVREDCLDSLLTVAQLRGGLFVLEQELFYLRIGKYFLCNDQSPQAIHCQRLAVFKDRRSLRWSYFVSHYYLCTLDVINVAAALFVFN